MSNIIVFEPIDKFQLHSKNSNFHFSTHIWNHFFLDLGSFLTWRYVLKLTSCSRTASRYLTTGQLTVNNTRMYKSKLDSPQSCSVMGICGVFRLSKKHSWLTCPCRGMPMSHVTCPCCHVPVSHVLQPPRFGMFSKRHHFNNNDNDNKNIIFLGYFFWKNIKCKEFEYLNHGNWGTCMHDMLFRICAIICSNKCNNISVTDFGRISGKVADLYWILEMSVMLLHSRCLWIAISPFIQSVVYPWYPEEYKYIILLLFKNTNRGYFWNKPLWFLRNIMLWNVESASTHLDSVWGVEWMNRAPTNRRRLFWSSRTSLSYSVPKIIL